MVIRDSGFAEGNTSKRYIIGTELSDTACQEELMQSKPLSRWERDLIIALLYIAPSVTVVPQPKSPRPCMTRLPT
ncbi:hypothetical protein XFF6990_10055 [Xanthomonas citri pv. fuscans]|uniref:Transposase n=1 Tax=Xanthomonas campestris pv. phaseoli TaxID=317013 RepID=A0A7Z7NJM2_XANCH|nr:hypothetical protein XFF6990_10055 [Xanthomonas citri pv. fuscans]SOO26467.1 hypothetical protein XFF6991_570032 [Xanthomonas phaseoli pv. phaseoli]